MKVLKGKFNTPGRPIQIREFPLAGNIAGTQPGPGALSRAERQSEKINGNIQAFHVANIAINLWQYFRIKPSFNLRSSSAHTRNGWPGAVSIIAALKLSGMS